MLLAGLFLAATARSLASPVPVDIPASSIPSPLCVVTAAISAGTCDPNKRRTVFDILYSCLGVIFLCTYIAIHHNIPDQNDLWVKKTIFKVQTMIYAMLAPEVVIMWALRQRIMAAEIAGHRWNREHNWTRTHGFFLQMGGLMLKREDGTFAVVTHTLGLNVPVIREKEILDRGKGDPLTKLIVVLQTSWFIAQCIARRIQGLVLTELELVTLAFAALNVMTYILWWDKPLNVQYPIYFDLNGNRVDGPEEKKEEAWYKQLRYLVAGNGSQESPKDESAEGSVVMKLVRKALSLIFGPLLQMTNVENSSEYRLTSVHPFYAGMLSGEQHQFAYICASVIGIVFGAIHLIGWNFPFSTTTELWLWRSSSLVLTIIPVFIPLSWRFFGDPYTTNTFDELLGFLIAYIGTPLYVAARVIVLFLAFFALRDLPESAYKNVRWSNFIPHI
ncbi:hypothetical protein AX16_008313 [Volvariella volvacea WC 439]|nr:hypothetical protein AX16_008313 [Volvariella volvacea WC 439]